ncbi:MAG: PIG-L family deacetylase [Bacteroidetes bacterium]|nr:PIG-L family deacetylase [Bacteroidota bacterium]
MRFIFLVISSLVLFSLGAQTSPVLNASEILLGLQKLNTVGSVLYIAAHPDDENTRLLAYLAREKKLRTAYLSITRGDGGQNLVGKEQGDALGLIRTQELLAARRIDGAEQFFTRANDFGFSKNPEETFSIWNKDSILCDVVWAIRKFKPDVIICRFPTTGEGGHGHHTASAILALEAYDAAADPLRFPEQLKYVEVWQAKRIFWNTFNFGGTNTTAPNQLKVDVGVYNPVLGKGYGEIASESRSMHKSQGFGSARGRGSSIEYFKLLKGDSAKTDLFQGIDQSWKRLKQASKIEKLIKDGIAKFNPLEPSITVPSLVEIYNQLSALDGQNKEVMYWKGQKQKECVDLLLACSGLWMEAYAADYTCVPGNSISLSVQVIKRNKGEAKLNKINYIGISDTSTFLVLKTNELYNFKRIQKLKTETPYSNPYWLNEKHGSNRFVVNDKTLIGKPENDPALKVMFDVEIGGLLLQVERGVVYKYTDPVKGELYRPLEILPLATITIPEKNYVFTDSTPRIIQFVIKSNASNVKGNLELIVPQGWFLEIKNPAFSIAEKGGEAIVDVMIYPKSDFNNGRLIALARIDGVAYTSSVKRIEYDHIPPQFILSPAETNLTKFDIKKAGNAIGYIPGAGDDVTACLKQIGYNVTVLTDDILTNGDISKYSAIITGVRAYNTNDRLQVHYNKLMDYVNKGGNLIVQYNTNNRIGPVLAKIGPYPFTISRDRVTDENAEVKILKPEHTVFNFPNKIGKNDFEAWVQERGIYFATEPDKNYEMLLSMNDPGEKASEGSLIVAKYGKGNFVYTGLAFFRELPAGVPGAYRLMVNLISLPQNK